MFDSVHSIAILSIVIWPEIDFLDSLYFPKNIFDEDGETSLFKMQLHEKSRQMWSI